LHTCAVECGHRSHSTGYRIEFSAPDGHLEVFDHNSGSTPNFEFRVGDALAPVDDGTPWDCGGGGVAWYSFAIARRG
jgi:hypothetical protein